MQVVMGGTWGFKALLPLGAELCLQAMLLARKFKRCGKKNGGWGGVVFKKKKSFLETSQSSNQDAELDVAKCPRGGQER